MKNMHKNSKSEEKTSCSCHFKPAELPDACISKIHEFEQELNKQGFWNIALVAYQKTE